MQKTTTKKKREKERNGNGNNKLTNEELCTHFRLCDFPKHLIWNFLFIFLSFIFSLFKKKKMYVFMIKGLRKRIHFDNTTYTEGATV